MRPFIPALLAVSLLPLSMSPLRAADADASKLFKPLPAVMDSPSNPITEAKVELGRALFYDTRLSTNNDVSCNSCHSLDKYGVDGLRFSVGHKKQTGDRNAPTVYNAAGHFVQFWDGRAPNVEEQAKGPVMNPVEMSMPSEAEVVARLKRSKEYVEMFRAAFPQDKDPVTFDNMAKAIAAFERKLVTPSRWDRYLKGDKTALTAAEQEGFRQFVNAGCASCHSGAYVGGAMYQKAGLVKPWPNTSDPGRFRVTKKETDKMMFKVPSLRNIAKTGPYFHDGSVTSLEEAVRLMAEHQTGKKLEPAAVKSIVAWLNALTGEIPKEYIAKPTLPR